MRSSHFYPKSVGRGPKARAGGLLRAFLVGGMLTALTPFSGSAQAPVYTNASPQGHTVCDNQAVAIGSWLTVTDLDLGETITWDVVLPPSNGSLTGFPATASTPGSSLVPADVNYIPNVGATDDAFTISVSDGVNPPVLMVVTLSVNAAPSLTLGTFPTVCRGVTNAVLQFSDLNKVGPDSVIFNYTGAVQTWSVPSNVTSLRFDLAGASGGHDSYSGSDRVGKGGRVRGTIAVFPGNTMNIYVGGMGGDGTPTGATGGYNGGGVGTFYAYGSGGGGGGATDIRLGGTSLANRILVAGGGGGNGQDLAVAFAGGMGGGLTGGNGETFNATAARGGTQSAGGAPSTYTGWAGGSFGALGTGGAASPQGVSGGGGGGYYGGGGGAWSAGGGGSSFTGSGAFNVTHTQGYNEGNGVAKLYYVNPGTYDIIWDATALAEGFENVADEELPLSEFNIAVPSLAAAGTYHATLTIRNYHGDASTHCDQSYPIEVTVRALPTVDNPGDFVVCHGDPVPDINFVSSTVAGNLHWENDNPAIGFDANGIGHIGGFSPINTSELPVSATIEVTPIEPGAGGLCYGTTQTFHIVDNPLPKLNSTLTPAAICNNTLFSYLPTSLTPGTSFSWSRAAVPGISNATATGTGNPNETLINTTIDPITVSYVYTLSANGCNNTQTVNVVVNPTPVMTSTASPAPLCNGAVFNYTPASSTGVAVLTWSRAVAAGISNAAASGSGAISETLVNTTSAPATVHYAITMTIGSCSYTEDVPVVVNPPMMLTSATSINICDSALLEYTPVANLSVATLSWTRAAVTGISNADGSGTGSIAERLKNTTTEPVTVNYVYTISAYACNVNNTVAVSVKPSAKLSSTLTPEGICTNSLFSYTGTTATAGTTFKWARDVKAGISNPASPLTSGASIAEILISTVDTVITVPYRFELTANGCANQEIVNVKVNPLPRIGNDTGMAICDSVRFSYVPTSPTPGATYAWSRAYEAGISNLPASGTSGTPGEYLNNTTYITVPVTYVYTITANGCSNTQNVVVDVRPSPVLVSNTATACSGSRFQYTPVSYTTGTEFAWARGTKTGIGNIDDTITVSSTSTVVYDMDLRVFGCVNKQKLNVTVNAAPTAAVIGTHPSGDLCNNVNSVNFGADVPAPDNTKYSWTATNATVHSTGSTGQYALINFNTPGTATVTLTITNKNTSCVSRTDYTVKVGDGSAVSPEIIFFDGQFICKETNTDMYQWGYDDAATLDSNALAGETHQNFYNPYPDWNGKYYWVITKRNGCSQKTYFNKPTGVEDMNIVSAALKLFPNPTTDVVNMEVSRTVTGKVTFGVYNMLGQHIADVEANNNTAQLSVAGLPAGAYVVDCYSDGMKVAAARFIKN